MRRRSPPWRRSTTEMRRAGRGRMAEGTKAASQIHDHTAGPCPLDARTSLPRSALARGHGDEGGRGWDRDFTAAA
jgi:hypothetical protein